jgi:hypothetical protein
MLFLLSFPYITSAFCPKYECASLPSNICIQQSGSTVQVSPCPSGTYCAQVPLPASSYCVSSTSQTVYSWPGEPCNPEKCAFGYCNGLICVGKSANDSCSVSDECDPGLFCQSGICSYLIPYNFGPCSSDFECASSAACDGGVCVKYFSKYEAEQTQCLNNESNACADQSCFQGYCLGGLNSDHGQAQKCSSELDCSSSKYSMPIFPAEFYAGCQCGLDAQQYCAVMTGDQAAIDYRSSLNDWVNSGGMQQCNTVRRFSQGCIKNMWDYTSYATLMYRMLLAQNYSQIMYSEECVVNVLFPNYAEFKAAATSKGLFLLAFAVSILTVF